MLYQIVFIVFFSLLCLVTIKSGSRTRSASDFSVANRSLLASGVSWIIVGTLVGGVSTVGTVQTAYTHGISAGIFTFGAGLSCLFLGCFFAKSLRDEGVVTVSECLGKYFGEKFKYYTSVFNSGGMFVHVVAQFLASIAILQAVFGFTDISSIAVTLLLITAFVSFGGISGAGLVGKIKFFMLYLIMVTCSGLALYKGGGIQEIISKLPVDQDMLGFSKYGAKTAAVDLFSMVVGVSSTQIYLQAIFSAKNIREARNGAFLSALVIPPIGVCGIIVGLYLRANFPELEGNAVQALPFFISNHFPPVIAAFFSAGILLIILGTGAGLALGVTTNIYHDFIAHRNIKYFEKFQPVRLLRIISFGVLLAACILVFVGLGSTILRWSYMSMGLRGAAVFVGLFLIVFMKKYCESRFTLVLVYALPVIYIVLNIV